MDLSVNDIKQKIKEYIIERYKVREKDLDEKADLFEEGIIDSLSAFEAVAFLEAAFGVKFEEEHFFDPRFRSIEGTASIIMEIKAH